jgi:exopolyphosphatase/guanosine-5'-triphosphate,3'-diphosphate pyrophosphatase
VRLTERHILHDPPLADEVEAVRTEVVGHLAATPFPSETDRPCLVGVAGTVTTLAAMVQNLRSYDPALVHGYRLTLPALDKQIDRLRASVQREREAMAGLDPHPFRNRPASRGSRGAGQRPRHPLGAALRKARNWLRHCAQLLDL